MYLELQKVLNTYPIYKYKLLSLEKIKETVILYFRNKPVKEVYLCGSYAKNTATPQSDIDILLFMDKENDIKPAYHLWSLELEEIFKTEVEVFIGSNEPYVDYKFAFFERMYSEKLLLYSKNVSI